MFCFLIIFIRKLLTGDSSPAGQYLYAFQAPAEIWKGAADMPHHYPGSRMLSTLCPLTICNETSSVIAKGAKEHKE